MGNDATKIFGSILDNSASITTEIRNGVYELLGINTQSIQLSEFVKECLEKFSFNVVEQQFLDQIKNIVIEEINKNDLKIKNNQSVDYELFSNNMIERLKQAKIQEFYLEDELKELADLISSRFPQINISRDQFYSHFSSKKEQISNMINKHNQNIVETLIKFTPQLSSELEQQARVNQKPIENQKTDNTNLTNGSISVEQFLSRCTEKLDEVNLMFQNGGNSKSEIAKGFRQLKSFIENLNDKTFAQSILDRYVKLNNAAQGVIYDKIIFENVPMLKDIYEKYDGLLVASQVEQLKNNLGSVFESKPAQSYIPSSGYIPREPAIEQVPAAVSVRDRFLQSIEGLEEFSKMEAEKAKKGNYTEQEKHDIREQLHQAQEDVREKLEWAKQQPNKPKSIYTGNLSNLPDNVKKKIIEQIEKRYGTTISGVENIYQEGNYIVIDARDKNGDFVGTEYSVEDFSKFVSEVQSASQVIQSSSSVENVQDQQIKANLVQQVINAMNTAGELSFGEISFSDRMSRMQNIRSGLENKSIEDLQILLATYQKQKPQNEIAEKPKEKVEEEMKSSSSVENAQEQQIKANLIQQVINAMNTAGELSFGEISFSDRMSRMQNIRSRLENKSIEDLQTLLATYQEQSFENEVQHSSSMRR